MSITTTSYAAVRVTHDSGHDFTTTRRRFEQHVPLLDPAVAAELVVDGATWAEVRAAVESRLGPHGLVALARVDQGALLSLNGSALEATLFLVGNPLIAREVTADSAAGALYAPFRVAVFADVAGTHISYDQPSSVFASLGSAAIDEIAVDLDLKMAAAAEQACGALPEP